MKLPLCTSLAIVAFACLALPAAAQRGNDFPDFAEFADGIFSRFAGETTGERQTLEGVEISVEEECQIGDAALEDFLVSLRRQNSRVLERGKDVQYLRALVDQLHPLMKNADRYRSIRVYIAEAKSTDARAFPGGAIVCMSGLIDFAENEAALVGVLAHELSHIDHGHQLRHVRALRLARDGFGSGAAIESGMLIARQFARPFRPEDETQADLDATRWMTELAYDSMEMARLFRRLHQRDQQGQRGGSSLPLPSFLRTHPYHADRYQAVKDLSTQLQVADANNDWYVGRVNLRRRIPRSESRFDE